MSLVVVEKMNNAVMMIVAFWWEIEPNSWVLARKKDDDCKRNCYSRKEKMKIAYIVDADSG
jgi:hypothetical protein